MQKRKLLVSVAAVFFSMTVYSQVGVNTSSPTSTLDITAKNATGKTTHVDGLLIPRVDRERAQSMTSVPTSTLIYVNSITTGTAAGSALNIDDVGYYYYNGTAWTKLTTQPTGSVNIYNADGTIDANRKVAQGDKTLAFTGTAVNAFSVDGATLSVDASNHRLGIKNSAPAVDVEIGSGSASDGVANPVLRIHSNANEAGKGGVLEFTEQGPGYGTVIKHHTSLSTDGKIKEGLHFVTRSNNVESVTPTLSIDQVDQRVGIGTGAPSTKLEINNGSVAGAIKVVDGTQGLNKVLTSDANGVGTWKDLPTSTDTSIYNSNGTLSADRTVTQGDKVLAFTGTKTNAFSVDGTTLSVDAANDRVGIGTSSPSSKLNLVGGSLVASKGENPANPLTNSHHDIAAPASTNEAVLLRLVNTSPAAANNTAFLGFNAYNGGGATWGVGSTQVDEVPNNSSFSILYSSGASYNRRLTILQNGNTGILTSTPQKTFHINGSLQLTNELNVGGTGSTAGSAGTAGQVLTSGGAGAAPKWEALPASADTNIYNTNGTLNADRIVTQGDKTLAFTGTKTNAFSVDGTTLSVDAANDRVGIGSSSPGQKLTVVDTGNTNVNSGIASFLANNLTAGIGIGYQGIQAIGSNADGTLALNAKGTGNITMQTSGTTGNVGIGTTAPTQKLDINGGLRISNINTNQGNGGIDRVVVADANGVLKTIGTGAYAMFHARLAANQNMGGSGGIPATLKYAAPTATSSLYSYNTSTGTLTFNEPGNYLVNMQSSFAKSTAAESTRYVLGIRAVPDNGNYISRGSHFSYRTAANSAGNPTIGDLMQFTTVITVPNAGYQVRFTGGPASPHTATMLATEEGTSGSGSVSNITIQKI